MADVKWSNRTAVPFATNTHAGDEYLMGMQGDSNTAFELPLLKEYFQGDCKKLKLFINTSTNAVTILESDFPGVTFVADSVSNGVLSLTANSPVFNPDFTFIPGGVVDNSGQPHFVTVEVLMDTMIYISLIKFDGTKTSTPNISKLPLSLEVFN